MNTLAVVTMRHSLLFLAMALFLFLNPAAAASEEGDLAIERMLKMLNKPYVKSFKDEFGVVFDCVDIYKQPALDHPLIKNHKIQVLPQSSAESTGIKPSAGRGPVRFGRQESCPDGTVLIRRTLKQDLIATAGSTAHLGRYRPNQEVDTPGVSREHFAQLLINSQEGSKFQSAGGVIEVDAFNMTQQGQSSSAQILLVDDSIADYVGVVQAGWQADDYKTTGCLNTLCSGFVLLSQTATPGMVLPPGNPIGISIAKDENGNWVVSLNQERVGYFPKQLFYTMDGATNIQMGGIAYAPAGQKRPPMGNGVAPLPDMSRAASTFSELGVGGANIGKYWLSKDVNDATIYNIAMVSNSTTSALGNSLQYGGPGDP